MTSPHKHNHQNDPTGEDAYDFVTTHAYPVRWYENRFIAVALVTVLFFPLLELQKALHLYPILSLSILGLSVAIAGWIGDIYFTHMALLIKPEFDRRRIEFPTAETAWLLPDYPTLKQLIIGWNTVLFMLIYWPCSYLYPPLGVCVFFVQNCAMFTNARQAKRFKKTLRLIDRKASAPHIPISPHQLASL